MEKEIINRIFASASELGISKTLEIINSLELIDVLEILEELDKSEDKILKLLREELYNGTIKAIVDLSLSSSDQEVVHLISMVGLNGKLLILQEMTQRLNFAYNQKLSNIAGLVYDDMIKEINRMGRDSKTISSKKKKKELDKIRYQVHECNPRV